MQQSHVNQVLTNGYATVPQDHLATVVTFLEMWQRPESQPTQSFPAGIRLQPFDNISLEDYRSLYRAVGEDWLWSSRLVMSDEKLWSILDDPRVHGFALRQDGRDLGILEMDFREPNACELVFFGLTAEAIGKGMGRALMNEAIKLAWAQPIKRFWVHTCTFDHPAALPFYRRAGFTPFMFQVEVFPDPRLTGVMPRNCSQHIPVLWREEEY